MRFRPASSPGTRRAALFGALTGAALATGLAVLLHLVFAARPASAAPAALTIGTADGLQAVFVPRGPADPRLDAAGSLPPAMFLHPISYRGQPLTQLYPADHIHHRGLFWGWRQVLLAGRPPANSWLMQGIEIVPDRADTAADGQSLTASARWVVDGRSILRETVAVRIRGNRLTLELRLTPLVEGLSLGGSPDDKGYGGISLRLVAPDALRFESNGVALAARPGPVDAGPAMRFSWDAGPDGGPHGGTGAGPRPPVTAVTLACTALGEPVTRWILRREASMQNCAWPGRFPLPLAKGRTLTLTATLDVTPET